MLAPAGNAVAEGYPASRPPDRAVRGRRPDRRDRAPRRKTVGELGQQVVTENIPGAGGNTGVTMVARAPADGYTILVVSTGFIVNPATRRSPTTR